MTWIVQSERMRRAKIGAILLLAGSMVLVAYSTMLAWQIEAAWDSAATASMGTLGSIGFVSLHAVRVLLLDHAALLSALRSILVLCSALIVTVLGLALLPKRVSRADALGASRASSLSSTSRLSKGAS